MRSILIYGSAKLRSIVLACHQDPERSSRHEQQSSNSQMAFLSPAYQDASWVLLAFSTATASRSVRSFL